MQQKEDESLLEKDFTVQGGDFIHAGEVSSRIKSILKEVGMSHDIIRRASPSVGSKVSKVATM